MNTAKQEVRALLQKLPNDCTLEDIQYHLYVRQKVLKGLEAARKGQVISHEAAVKRGRKWLKK